MFDECKVPMTYWVPTGSSSRSNTYELLGNAKRRVECEAQRSEAQALVARCANLGSAYAQVRGVIFRRDDKELARFEGGAYILPGARKVVRVESGSPASAGPAQMDIQFDDGTVQSQAVNLP